MSHSPSQHNPVNSTQSPEGEFDPLHKWLGIPPREQPPNHYRLLAIDLFEADADVIEAAANARMSYVRQCAIGPHANASQQVLNNLSEAQLCLLNPHKKAAYDSQLKSTLQAKSETAEPKEKKHSPAKADTDPKLTQLTQQLDKQKKQIESLLEKCEFAAAISALEKVAAVKNPKAAKYVKWAKQQLPKAKRGTQEMRESSAAMYRTATDLFERNDYEEAAEILQQLPQKYRNSQINELLQECLDLQEEITAIQDDIDRAESLGKYEDLQPTLERLLEIKPNDRRAKKLLKELKTYGKGGGMRLGGRGDKRFDAAGNTSNPLKVAMFVGIPLLLFGIVGYATVVYVRSNNKTIKIEIDDPSAKVTIDGKEIKITGVGDTTKLKVGQHDLKVERDDLVVHTRKFEVVKGKNPVLRISLQEATVAETGTGGDTTGNVDEESLVYLADLKEVSVNDGPWPFSKGKVGNSQIKIEGTVYPRALSMHPPGNGSRIVKYQLSKQYRDFVAKVGLTRAKIPAESLLTFSVIGDGKELWKSKPTRQPDPPQSCQIDVSNVDLLELHVYSPGAASGAHAAWLDPHLISVGGSSSPAGGDDNAAPQANGTLAVAPFDAVAAKKYQQDAARRLGTPVETTNSIGMKFRLIPAGRFMMGSPQAEIASLLKTAENQDFVKRYPSEGPQRQMTLTRPFFIGLHEVTQAEYEKVMGNNPSAFTAGGAGKDKVTGLDTRTLPVEQVNWFDAVDFCVKLSQDEGLKPCYSRNGETVQIRAGTGYRLPTEAEWEFACRAGTETRWSFGDDPQQWTQYGWFFPNAENRPHAVGKLRANQFGLYDMYGNVWEWCQDWHAYDSYTQDNATVDAVGISQGTERVLRGGSVVEENVRWVRSAYRGYDVPENRQARFGFRIVRTAPAGKEQAAIRPKPSGTVSVIPDTVSSRQAAEWVLGLGGTISTDAGTVKTVDELPEQPFEILKIELSRKQVTNEGLANLRGLENLTDLHLVNTAISDAGLTHLKGLTNLETLLLSNTQITDSGLVALQGLTKLITFYAETVPIRGEGLKHLQGMKDLAALRLGRTQVDDSSLVHLKDMTSLTDLRLGHTPISSAGLVHLKGLTNLSTLILDGTQISDTGLANFQDMTKLINLHAVSTPIRGEGLKHLQRMEGLVSLRLQRTQIDDSSLVYLKDMTSLTDLRLGHTSISGVGLAHLKGLTNLETLILNNTQITDKGLVSLQGMTKLITIFLDNAPIRGEGLKHLQGLAGLVHLQLTGTQINDSSLAHLKGSTSLTALSMTNTKVTANGVADLQKSLPKCKITH